MRIDLVSISMGLKGSMMSTLNSDVGRELFVGIDVGKLRLDIACGQDGEQYGVDNTDTGINALVARLQALCEDEGPPWW